MLHRSPPRAHRGWLLAALAYFTVASLAHLEVSLWLVKQRSGAQGSFAFRDFVPDLAVAGGAVLAIWLAYQAWKTVRPWPVLALWALLALCVALVDRFLTFSAAEYAHYPQYALLAWLLARALDPDRRRHVPGRILLWTTLLGAVDETVQYLWITAGYSEYLDFNDILVNMIGGMAGILLYYGLGRRGAPRAQDFPRVELVTALVLALAIGVGLQQQRIMPNTSVKLAHSAWMRDAGDQARLRLYLQRTVPGRHGSYNQGPYRGKHWILDPASAAALSLIGGSLFCLLATGAYRAPAAPTASGAAPGAAPGTARRKRSAAAAPAARTARPGTLNG